MASAMLAHRRPVTALILLAGIAFAGAMLFSVFAFVLGYFIYGQEIMSSVLSSTPHLGMQKLLISFSSVGMFVVSTFVFARLQTRKYLSYLQFTVPKPWVACVLVVLIMMSVMPFIEWTVYLNQQMKLPEFLSKVETWIKYKEMEVEILTRRLLVMNDLPTLMLNLVIIGAIPAIGEELIFRGCIQKIFAGLLNNAHLGIWFAAIIFSAIHFQFYGFLPRMLLGVLFGYMLFFTKSIWVPILAHFCNNASAVVSAYIMQKDGKSLEEFTKPSVQSWYLVAISIIFTAMLFGVLYKVTAHKQDGQ